MGQFDLLQFSSAFIALFAVIDIIGSVPIILSLKSQGRGVASIKATLISTVLLLTFFFAGESILKLFHVDLASFATAGALVILLMALEMILDIEIFKNTGPIKEATLVPLVFPLIAGPAAFTTLLTLKTTSEDINILLALIANMLWVFLVLVLTAPIEKMLGKGGIYIARKFFGIILLAISAGLLTENITKLITQFHAAAAAGVQP